MSTTINGSFNSRRNAEMAVERLVQEFGLERTDIFVAAEGKENSAGPARAGSDDPSGGHDARDDGAHEGAVTVSVDVNDDAVAERVTGAFEEFGGVADEG